MGERPGLRWPIDMTEERRRQIARIFPNLELDYVETSCETDVYNCIAWSFYDTRQWWWPTPRYGNFWLELVPRDNQVSTVVKMFELHGYVTCDGAEMESGYEKVAIYERPDSGVEHVARQLRDGYWTSKLGEWEDIRHRTAKSVECADYGRVVQYLKRRRPEWQE
jgi:hypothetical protein